MFILFTLHKYILFLKGNQTFAIAKVWLPWITFGYLVTLDYFILNNPQELSALLICGSLGGYLKVLLEFLKTNTLTSCQIF